ncbi:FAD-dependent thymidylate synthase [bacterium]|nr:FAD-dependent thymidylate synthase [bacterium]
MQVSLLSHTPQPDLLVALSARRCYSSLSISDLEENFDDSEIDRLLGILRSRNHLSPFEHANFTFSVMGISRALSHQLVRHRMASYSQESQRFVEYLNLPSLPFVIPPTIENVPHAKKIFLETMKKMLETYRELRSVGVPGEDARYIFPNSLETKLVFSMNARSLFNFFEQRCCQKAQWEIRKLANYMLSRCKAVSPRIFQTAGAPCGYSERPYCRENDQACSRFPPHLRERIEVQSDERSTEKA